jgi:uncharacterized protein YndB with AHSA1/START domain
MNTSPETDRIEKQTIVHAPRSKVWQAIADAQQFGAWFPAKLEGPFTAGKAMRGPILHPGYTHLTLEMDVERIEPERYFSFRWHPDAVDPKVDYSKEPKTLVEFTLDDAADGTLLKIVESGFDRIPVERRAAAYRDNADGWQQQLGNIERFVTEGKRPAAPRP